MRKPLYFLLAILTLLLFSSGNPAGDPGKKRVKYPYLLYVPQTYETDSASYPVLFYLHGHSARGSDLNRVKRYGPPFYVERGRHFPFFIASPQCPSNRNWTSENWLDPLLEELMEKYRIDTNRLYLTGMSLGAFGAWQLGIERPHLFAAIAPLCGGTVSNQVCNMKDIPIWAFHGSADRVVPVHRTESIVKQLERCEGNIKYSRLNGQGHNIHRVYADSSLYNWFMQQNRLNRAPDQDSTTNVSPENH